MRERELEREGEGERKREQLKDNQSLIFLGYFIKWNEKVKLLYTHENFIVLSYLKRESNEINKKICIQYYIFFVHSLVVSEIFGFCAKKLMCLVFHNKDLVILNMKVEYDISSLLRI